MSKLNSQEKLEKQRRKVLRNAIWKLTKYLSSHCLYEVYEVMEDLPIINSEKSAKIKSKCEKKLAKLNPKQDKKKKATALPNDAHHTS